MGEPRDGLDDGGEALVGFGNNEEAIAAGENQLERSSGGDLNSFARRHRREVFARGDGDDAFGFEDESNSDPGLG